MAAATLGAGARPLPVGADTWAALMDCASSTGAGAGLALPLDLASAAPDVTSTAQAQRRTKANPRPTEMPVDEGAARRLRVVRTLRSRICASGAAQPGTSSSIAIVNSWSCRSGSALRTRTPTASAYQPRATPGLLFIPARMLGH